MNASDIGWMLFAVVTGIGPPLPCSGEVPSSWSSLRRNRGSTSDQLQPGMPFAAQPS